MDQNQAHIKVPTNHRIYKLPEYLVDQIKAGEVIERPASMLKELVENAIDAKSSRIDIQIRNNGMDFLQISDNGSGILINDLPLAFSRHATSKIKSFEDLYKILSYGFRGEALASIASIARVSCLSIPAENIEQAGKIVYDGGKLVEHLPYAGKSHGTTISIQDLFFNTPARLKFLKSKNSEKSALKRILCSYLLTNPQITFTVKWDDKDKQIFPALDRKEFFTSLKTRTSKLLGTPADQLINVEGSYQGYRVQGLVALEMVKNSSASQFIFVNGRPCIDNNLHQTIRRAMEPWWGPKSSLYVIMLEVPPAELDVNVHPAKTQIKFQHSAQIFSLLFASIQKSMQNYAGKRPTSNQAPHAQGAAVAGNFQAQFGALANMAVQGQSSSLNDNRLQNTSGAWIPLSMDFYLSTNHQVPTLLSLKQLAREFFGLNFKNFFPLNLSETIPLLISEPLSIKPYQMDGKAQKIDLGHISKAGFEVSTLSDDMIMVSSIPAFLKDFHPNFYLKTIFNHLLRYTSQSEELDKSALVNFLIHDFEPELNYFPMNRIDQIINQVSAGSGQTPFKVELTEQKLQALMTKQP